MSSRSTTGRNGVVSARHASLTAGKLIDAAAPVAVRGDACRVLCDRYDVACLRRFEGRTKDDLEMMAASLMSG